MNEKIRIKAEAAAAEILAVYSNTHAFVTTGLLYLHGCYAIATAIADVAAAIRETKTKS